MFCFFDFYRLIFFNDCCILIQYSFFKEYLHSQQCIHGNIGARGVLVGGDLTAKLWGFGSLYRRKTQGVSLGAVESMELRKWQAPEVLSRRAFSHSSDVWVSSSSISSNQIVTKSIAEEFYRELRLLAHVALNILRFHSAYSTKIICSWHLKTANTSMLWYSFFWIDFWFFLLDHWSGIKFKQWNTMLL